MNTLLRRRRRIKLLDCSSTSCSMELYVPGGSVQSSAGQHSQWLFYIIVAALLVVLVLSVLVIVAWRQLDKGYDCPLPGCLLSISERLFHRKPEATRRPTQPTTVPEERSRLRTTQSVEVVGMFRLTVPTVSEPSPSSTGTSDSLARLLLPHPPAKRATSANDIVRH